MPHDDTIREQAVAWAVRTGDPAFEDWDGFTAWLEQDAAHAAAYDAVSAAVAEAAEDEAERPVVANDEEPARPLHTRRWFGGALAGCLATLAVLGVWQFGSDSETFVTAPGETRLIALEDGGTIELAGDSRLVLDDENARFARLEAGQALFTIAHDEANPFVVEAGEDTLVDLGTIFDVRTGNGLLTVAVSEGAVAFNPKRQDVLLRPGDVLNSAVGSAEYTVKQLPLAQVGEWRSGRLTFQQSTLAEVATDLSRATGIAFAAAPESANRRVSGSLLVAPVNEDPRALGPLLGVTLRPEGERWVIEAP